MNSLLATVNVVTFLPLARLRISGSRVRRPVSRTLFTVRSPSRSAGCSGPDPASPAGDGRTVARRSAPGRTARCTVTYPNDRTAERAKSGVDPRANREVRAGDDDSVDPRTTRRHVVGRRVSRPVPQRYEAQRPASS